MDYLLPRPAQRLDPAQGLLRAEHFQMAYATTDIDRACDLLGRRLGIGSFRTLEGPTAAGGFVRTRLAWVGTIMYELIEATGPGADLYMSVLGAEGGFRLAHHHLGYLLHDAGALDAVVAGAERQGWAVPYRSRNPLVDVCFVAVPELGHLLEYLLPSPAGLQFFNDVPRH